MLQKFGPADRPMHDVLKRMLPFAPIVNMQSAADAARAMISRDPRWRP